MEKPFRSRFCMRMLKASGKERLGCTECFGDFTLGLSLLSPQFISLKSPKQMKNIFPKISETNCCFVLFFRSLSSPLQSTRLSMYRVNSFWHTHHMTDHSNLDQIAIYSKLKLGGFRGNRVKLQHVYFGQHLLQPRRESKGVVFWESRFYLSFLHPLSKHSYKVLDHFPDRNLSSMLPMLQFEQGNC